MRPLCPLVTLRGTVEPSMAYVPQSGLCATVLAGDPPGDLMSQCLSEEASLNGGPTLVTMYLCLNSYCM
jgi:hypothetical protein